MKRNKWNWDVIIVFLLIGLVSFTLWYNIIKWIKSINI
jgi:hypothetical protein